MVTSNDGIATPSNALPLDPSLYELQDNEIAFFKAQTGIDDDKELRDHILAVQAEAYAIHPYPCIRSFKFATLKISKSKFYEAVLKVGRERPDAILLDLGCCVGNDVRKVIADGYPRDSIISSDIQPEFWTIGHKLFRSTPDTFPVPFIPGDIFDSEFLSPNTSPAPRGIPASSLPSIPPLAQVKSLTQLQHHISVLHTASFFHLFDETQQRALAHILGTLLSPIPGSLLFGSHLAASDEQGTSGGGVQMGGCGWITFGHTPTSWKELWVGEGGIFRPGEVVVSASTMDVEEKSIVEAGAAPGHFRPSLLVWSVTRV